MDVDQPSGGVAPSVAPDGDSRSDRVPTSFARFVGDEQDATETGFRKYHPSLYRRGLVLREARTTLAKQIEHCNDIDAKAMRTFRFNLLLLGLFTPALTLAVRYGPVDGIAAFYSSDVTIGVVCLLSSAVLAGLTYTSSSVAVGMSSGAITDARRRNLTDRSTHDTLLDSYAAWIRTNDRTILQNSLLVTATILLLIYAVVFLALGATSALVGPLPASLRWFTYVVLLALTPLSRLL